MEISVTRPVKKKLGFGNMSESLVNVIDYSN